MNQRLARQAYCARGVDDRDHARVRVGIQALIAWILRRVLCDDEQQRRQDHVPRPATVTTELGVPNSSSRAAGAPGSARHSTPFTRNA